MEGRAKHLEQVIRVEVDSHFHQKREQQEKCDQSAELAVKQLVAVKVQRQGSEGECGESHHKEKRLSFMPHLVIEWV